MPGATLDEWWDVDRIAAATKGSERGPNGAARGDLLHDERAVLAQQ
jgi:hypothetical protein